MVDVVVVGAGPNELAAAITCAEAGRSVVVVEAAATVGGGTPQCRAHAARFRPRRVLPAAGGTFLLVEMLTALPPAQLASRLPTAGVLRRD